MRWRSVVAGAILLLGSLQIAGDLMGSRLLKGIGVATVFAPYPKVFCDVKGLEPFASKFTLLAQGRDGAEREIAINPEFYAKLGGPYNRRNVYGAALSYAPRLPEPLWQAVCRYGLKSDGPLRQAFGLAADENIRIRIATQTAGRKDVWILEPRPNTLP